MRYIHKEYTLYCYYRLNFDFLVRLNFAQFLIVFCTLSDPPQVSIQLGKSLVASDIREGVDVYFDCLVSANPTPKSKLVTWLHNVSNCSNIVHGSLVIVKQIICV